MSNRNSNAKLAASALTPNPSPQQRGEGSMPEMIHLMRGNPHFKALDEAQGIAEMIVSVFSNVDYADQRMMPGAFAKSLLRKFPKGVWAHNWDQPIAKTLEARELLPGDALLPEELQDLGGLYIKTQFNLGTQRGRDAFSDLGFGSVDEFSIGFYIVKQTTNKQGITDIIEVDLVEWSPVLVGCNNATQLISVKERQALKERNLATKKDAGIRTPAFKAVYLGESAEGYAAMGAIARLDDALFYNVLYNLLFDKNTPLAERLETLASAFDEFRDISVHLVGAVLASPAEGQVEGDTDEAVLSALGDAVHELWRDPADKKHLAKRVAIVKAGKAISAANHAKLTDIHEKMAAGCADLKCMLDANEQPEDDDPDSEETKTRTVADVKSEAAALRRLALTARAGVDEDEAFLASL